MTSRIGNALHTSGLVTCVPTLDARPASRNGATDPRPRTQPTRGTHGTSISAPFTPCLTL
ncbi:hypothetical protein DB346_16545 [Verrucomicrobia bacterium LW23]|nr:hypothetical protein DB346_16545 [Verrucomicrobia bacterium LW23]